MKNFETSSSNIINKSNCLSDDFKKIVNFIETDDKYSLSKDTLCRSIPRVVDVCNYCEKDYFDITEKDIIKWLDYKQSEIKFATLKNYYLMLRTFGQFVEKYFELINVPEFKNPFTMEIFYQTCPSPYQAYDKGQIPSLIGEHFGDLEVIGEFKDEKTNRQYLTCKCTCDNCGEIRDFLRFRVVNGIYTNCGSPKHPKTRKKSKVVIGNDYNNWHVLYKLPADPERKDKHSYYHCRCKLCGREKDVRGTSLTDGTSSSCGCERTGKES